MNAKKQSNKGKSSVHQSDERQKSKATKQKHQQPRIVPLFCFLLNKNQQSNAISI
ncbi:hypothetical protein [Niallia sp.]|uniref:hypothetical protein n=1 Tax=Niallia sp. TaxID=2837523 RepID=UPI00289C6FAB|nr:hypothetical protein [Niallia sp.]